MENQVVRFENRTTPKGFGFEKPKRPKGVLKKKNMEQKQQDFLEDICKTHIEKKDFNKLIKALEQTISKVRVTNEIIDAKQIAISDVFESIAICLVLNITENKKPKNKKWDIEKNRVEATEGANAEQNQAEVITCNVEVSDYEKHL